MKINLELNLNKKGWQEFKDIWNNKVPPAFKATLLTALIVLAILFFFLYTGSVIIILAGFTILLVVSVIWYSIYDAVK